MKKQQRVWDLYPALTAAVKKTHDAEMERLKCRSFHCHDFDHALRVGDRAMEIAEDKRVGQLAAVAGLCHNADRILQKSDGSGPFGKVEDHRIVEMCSNWLNTESLEAFTAAERDTIFEAVLRHSRPNGADDHPVTIALMDADRTVNIELDVVIRSGQYFGDMYPVIDPVHFVYDPEASFKNPRCILRSEIEKFDWAEEGGFVGLRLPKARKLAESRFTLLQEFLQNIIRQRMESGLHPYPVI